MRRLGRGACRVAAFVGACAAVAAAQPRGPGAGAAAERPVVVASKPFAESYILAEMFAQLLEQRGYRVERRPGLGATEVAFAAVRAGAVDVYPEYTGTGLLAILHDSAATTGDRRHAYRRVATAFHDRFGTRWLPPLGFENTYAIAMRRGRADSLGVRTLSDLARVSPRVVAGLTPDFIGRPDGLPGLRRAYGFAPREVRSLLPAVKYRALASGNVDVIDGYSTDGLIAQLDLLVLDDDRGFFPPYEAAALLGRRAAANDGVVSSLSLLSGRVGEALMRRLNARVEAEHADVRAVAAAALAELGLSRGGASASTNDSGSARASLGAYLWDRRAVTVRLAGTHLLLVLVSLLAAVAVAVPAGLVLERAPRTAEPVIRATGLLQTIPGIALLAFMIPLLGIGVLPSVVALFLYSLYPIVRNTYTGVRDADPAAVDAALALGMTATQVLRYVRLPLAVPVIMAGVRTSAVIGVGTATLAAFIGAGGLGEPIVTGLALADTRLVLAGAVPAAMLALLVDAALAALERHLRSVS